MVGPDDDWPLCHWDRLQKVVEALWGAWEWARVGLGEGVAAEDSCPLPPPQADDPNQDTHAVIRYSKSRGEIP